MPASTFYRGEDYHQLYLDKVRLTGVVMGVKRLADPLQNPFGYCNHKPRW